MRSLRQAVSKLILSEASTFQLDGDIICSLFDELVRFAAGRKRGDPSGNRKRSGLPSFVGPTARLGSPQAFTKTN